MIRTISLMLLMAAVLLVGGFFVRIVWPFVIPLLFAAVLTILFRPVFSGILQLCGGRRRIAAALTTLVVFLLLMLPLTTVLLVAGVELVDAGRDAMAWFESLEVDGMEGAPDGDVGEPLPERVFRTVQSWLGPEEQQQLQDMIRSAVPALTSNIYERTRGLVGNVVLGVIGTVIVILGFYYLLAEGARILAEVDRLSPLEHEDLQLLFQQFEDVCRAVVLGTVAAGLVQAALAAIGFAIIGVDRIWLLAVLTMSASFIPFLGAAMIWICVAVTLVLEQRYVAAGFLTVYGTVVVSGADNVIKAVVIGNRARMHPFIVLVTVLGALQLVGLWGVFVGPVTAAVFYSLINIVHRRLVEPAGSAQSAPPSVDAAAPGGDAKPDASGDHCDGDD